MLVTVPAGFPLSHHGSTVNEHGFAIMRSDAGNVQTQAALSASIERRSRINYLNGSSEVVPKHHVREFSSAVVEPGAVTVDYATMEGVNLFTAWVAHRLSQCNYGAYQGEFQGFVDRVFQWTASNPSSFYWFYTTTKSRYTTCGCRRE